MSSCDKKKPNKIKVKGKTVEMQKLKDLIERVKWIKNEVMPKWDAQRTERPDEARRNMQTIIERGRAAGGSY